MVSKGNRGREIPINDELHEALLKQKEKSSGRYVLEKTNKKRYDRKSWLNFKRLLRKLGIEDVNIRTFRHTFASDLITGGVNLVTVKELHGHRDVSTTMRYAHLVPNHKIWAVNSLCASTKNGTILAQAEKLPT